MHRQAENDGGQRDPPPLDGPEQAHGQDAQQALGAPAGADGGDHGVPEPEGREAAGLLGGHAPAAQHAHHEPAGEEVGGGEDELAKGVEADGREQQPGEQRRVAVGVAGVRGVTGGEEAGRVGEDEVVDVGVLEGRVGVLPEAVDEKDEAEEGGDGEEGNGRRRGDNEIMVDVRESFLGLGWVSGCEVE